MKTLVSLFVLLSVIPGCFIKKLSTTPTAEIKAVKEPVTTSPLLAGILQQHPQYFDSLLRHNEQWQIKIIYTQIDRKAGNHPVFKNYYFNIDPRQYFYPASTVKMPTAILALQRLKELNIEGLDRTTMMITDSGYSRQDAVYNDPDAPDGRPTIENYIRKIFLVSDNDAYNRLYEFLGQEYINRTLHEMGYDSVQIIHRLNIFRTEDENRHTNPVKFYDTSARLIYKKSLTESKFPYQLRNTFMGKGYYSGNKLINEPFDFSTKNRLSLADLHSILQAVIFPQSVTKQQRFQLSKDDYHFLYRYMSMKPGESDISRYRSYHGAYSKLLMYGGKGDMADHIRIFNKEGDAYGFLTDVAYVVDFQNKIEFFLSASIYCNSDGIFNDDRYDYESVGLTFLKNLGQIIYQYELQRKRKRIPDLSTFDIDYNK